MKGLNDVKWKAYKVGDLFEVKRPAARNKDFYQTGDIFFVASGAANNGVMKCCTPQKGEKLDKGNCLTVSPVDGTCFYQPIDFLGRGGAGSSILLLYHKSITLNQAIGLFLSRALFVATSQYSYGRMANTDSIKKTLFLLPSTPNGEPDYEFMEQYMKAIEKKLLTRYQSYLAQRKPNMLNDKRLIGGGKIEWKAFVMEDLFDIKPGIRLTKESMISGTTPFIGASDSNNGVTAFCGNVNKSLDSNVVGVNYNGSVVENFYHPYKAVFSDDVKRVKLKKHEGNKYTYLFIKNLILKQKQKFQYGYKFNGERMAKQNIILPVNEKGQPDYPYMEAYMSKKESEILTRYVKHRLSTL